MIPILMKTIPVSLFCAGILLPMAGVGQSPAPNADSKPDRKPLMEAWKAADLDHDGLISKSEYEALPRIQNLPAEKRSGLFTRLDKDADGQLSVPELSQAKKPDQGVEKPMKRLWELDTDHSGGLSFNEYKLGHFVAKLPPEKQEALFKRLDTDADGSITPKDRPEPARSKRPGQDSQPTPPPFVPEQMVKKLDTDQDGLLSFAEFRLGHSMKDLSEDLQEKRFDKIDANKDLKVSLEELIATHRQLEPRPQP